MKVVVVGAGVVGTAVAVSLRDRGVDVVLLERAVPGAEASTAAAGILGAQAECDDDGPFFDLCRAGLDATWRWAARIDSETGIDVQLRKTGALVLADDDAPDGADDDRLRRRVAWQQKRGARAELVDRKRIADVYGDVPDDVRGAAFFVDDARIEPRALFLGLQVLAKKAGVDVVRDHPIVAVDVARDGDGDVSRGVVLADQRRVDADAVVVCAGAWSATIAGVPLTEDDVFPVRGCILELAPESPPTSCVVFGRGGYLVPRIDGSVLAGSTVERVGFDKTATPQGRERVETIARALAPSLSSAPARGFWAGLRPGSRDDLPLLGETSTKGLFLATGHYRNGILLAAISAELIARAVVDRIPPPSAFSPRRF